MRFDTGGLLWAVVQEKNTPVAERKENINR
jgi:hypothetical protein